MAGIQEILGLIAPARTTPAADRSGKADKSQSTLSKEDEAVFSAESRSAAQAARSAAAAEEIRQARIEEARKRIEQGAHQIQSVVELVASRISKYLV